MTQSSTQNEFVAMIKQHERLILKVCTLFSNFKGEDLRDLYQDAVCALWESYPSFRHESKESTWIFAVSRHTILNIMRKRRTNEVLVDNEITDVSGYDESTKDIIDELRMAIAHLDPAEKDIFIMWMEGFKNSEIAETTNLSEGNVAVKLTRIKKKLKKEINIERGNVTL